MKNKLLAVALLGLAFTFGLMSYTGSHRSSFVRHTAYAGEKSSVWDLAANAYLDRRMAEQNPGNRIPMDLISQTCPKDQIRSTKWLLIVKNALSKNPRVSARRANDKQPFSLSGSGAIWNVTYPCGIQSFADRQAREYRNQLRQFSKGLFR